MLVPISQFEVIILILSHMWYQEDIKGIIKVQGSATAGISLYTTWDTHRLITVS
jgi:hypothetical protein